MIALYLVLPLALIIAGSAVAAFIWSVRAGQLDDVETPPRRMLFDDVPITPGLGAEVATEQRAGLAPRDGSAPGPHEIA